jgi:hypothetical protein
MQTLATMRARAKTLADMTDSDKISTAEWNELLNDGISLLYDVLVSKHENHFEATYVFDVQANVSDYALPVGFMKLLSVNYRASSTDDYLRMFPYELKQETIWENRNSQYYASDDQAPFYTLAGNYIRVLPVPSNGQIRLRYVPVCPILEDDDDSMDSRLMDQWSKFVIWSAVADAKALQEDDPTFAEGKMQQMRQHIERSSLTRDLYQPRVVQDVGNNRGW